MPYLMQTVEGARLEREARSSPPFGPGFTDKQIVLAERMEIWASTAADAGGDFTEFRLLACGGRTLETKRVGGY